MQNQTHFLTSLAKWYTCHISIINQHALSAYIVSKFWVYTVWCRRKHFWTYLFCAHSSKRRNVSPIDRTDIRRTPSANHNSVECEWAKWGVWLLLSSYVWIQAAQKRLLKLSLMWIKGELDSTFAFSLRVPLLLNGSMNSRQHYYVKGNYYNRQTYG